MTDRKPNALIDEASPYLLQHAYNPVAWMPWGEAAFAKAKAEDKPVFLSIGYATCHWCHVMERESFESEHIAEFLNANFVPIKVDREERPDIDAVYMAITQALNDGRGGWPMSLWLTPDKQPITAGTYFPPDDRWGRTGFLSILGRISELWRTEREKLIEQAAHITDWVKGQGAPEGTLELSEKTLAENVKHHAMRFDAKYGGFDGAPKFPTPHRVQTLLHYAARGLAHFQNENVPDPLPTEALAMAEVTLDNMARGGLRDHIGGGFHRYSTDREWLTPHFEKMLYDNALMIEAYLDAYQLTGKPEYADVVRDVAAYVLRDLRDEAGGFHSAEDADSEGEEGKFYVWTMDELRKLLGKDADLAAFIWGCTEAGNYREESTHEHTGANILHLPRSVADAAKLRDLTEDELRERMKGWRAKLFEVRGKRVRPLLDDKVLTDWNGLMIGALARAGAALGVPEYVKAAQEAVDFILGTMVKDGRLLHRYRSGKAGILAFAEDYGFMINGLIALYQTDFNTRWLRESDRLAAAMLDLFLNKDEDLLHTAGRDEADAMIAPNRDTYDGAIPSANSAGALALIRLGRLLQREEYVQQGERILQAVSTRIVSQPAAHSYALMALEWVVWPSQEIVIAGDRDDATVQSMLTEARRTLLPRALVVLHEPGSGIAELIPQISQQGHVDGKPAAYVCENFTCRAPVTNAAALANALAEAR
jgi:hypothetical protein